ncbi:protein kinase domain-containing protein [Actinoplanes sp. URMC 104]|uniref:serine/threonine-protein kinase n=1 Tax=Actinoplanes sp. URMC 104 TaxID=3423409 RepID=UPI003F1AE90F
MTQDRTSNRSSAAARADTPGTSTMDLSGRCVGSSYVLQRPIGQGATGTVWLALDRTSGESVAVKLLHESLLRQPRLVTRFVQERTILRMLRHRNVVRVRDLFSVGETLGLVMDLVNGGSLRDLLRERHTLPAGEAARLTAQVAAALAEAHELGIVHRDLKPDNILLAFTDGRPDTRLTDFGVARILNTPSMTTPNAVVGTPHYMSPEAFHGARASPATDVYALGVLLYELVSGRPPYLSDSIPDLMRRHCEGNLTRRPGLPDPLWDLVTACMALKPRLRPTAAELVADLSDISRRFADVPALPRPAEEPPAHPSFASLGPSLSASLPRAQEPAAEVPAPALPSVIPAPRHPGKRNAVPRWRWARPGATFAAVAGAMVASAAATTAWHMGRSGDQPHDLAVREVVTVPATPSASGPSPVGLRRSSAPASRGSGHGRPIRPVVTAAAPAPASSAVRSKPAQPSARRKPARSPQPEARPYGPWQCAGTVGFDFPSRLGFAPKVCHMVGRDIRYQGSLTGFGGGSGSMQVQLRDAATGRVVGEPRTCTDLVFEGRAATRDCGPGATTPRRGRSYTVVMTFRFEREGRMLASTFQGRTFSW